LPNHSAVMAVPMGTISAVPMAKIARKISNSRYSSVKIASAPADIRNAPTAKVLFRPKRATTMLIGRDTTARERGAIDAYHPAALRLIPKVSIKSGIRGPAEAQFIPRHERMRTIIPNITNRYRLLLFKEGIFYPTISNAIFNDTPIEYSVAIFQVVDIETAENS